MLTLKQVAAPLGISASLVYSLCEDRILPHYRMGGKGKRGKPSSMKLRWTHSSKAASSRGSRSMAAASG